MPTKTSELSPQGEETEVLPKKHYPQNINNNVVTILQKWVVIEEISPHHVTHEMIQEVLSVSCQWFWIAMTYEDIKNHLSGSERIFLIKERWVIQGFSSTKTLNGMVYHYGTVISPRLQGSGIFTQLNEWIIQAHPVMFLRTQNQNIIASFEKLWAKVYLGTQAFERMSWITQKAHFDDFFGNACFEDGIFKWVYGAYLGTEQTVQFITDSMYPGMQPQEGDALLVLIEKN